MFRKKKQYENLQRDFNIQKNALSGLIESMHYLRHEIKETIKYKETAEQNLLAGKVFSELLVKEYEKDKDNLVFIKCDKDKMNYYQELLYTDKLHDAIPNVKIIIHSGEFDNFNIINSNEYINAFNKLFKGLYKIVKDNE